MKLSVVIVSFNVRHFLELCLQSVLAATKEISSEIIVVDNNSGDGTKDYFNLKYPEIKFIAQSENLGFSKANNLGVQQASGEYVCILNPDTIVPENVFESILERGVGISNIGVVGCKLIDGSGKFLPESKRNIISSLSALKKILGLPSNYYAEEIDKNENGNVPVLVGAFMFLKRDLYLKVGGFDEDYFMYGEDFDLSYKVEKLNFSNFYLGELAVVHFKGESTTNDLVYAKHFYKAMTIFYTKHFNSNKIFSSFATIIFKVFPYLKSTKKQTSYNENYPMIVISNKLMTDVRTIFPKLTKVVAPNNFSLEPYATYVFDCESLKFEDMIEILESNEGNEDNQFLFWPMGTTYFVGSIGSQSKGIIVDGNTHNYGNNNDFVIN